MIKVDSYYKIAADEVEAITTDRIDGEYPHRLKITTKAGREYRVTYKSKEQRDREAARVAIAVDQAISEQTLRIDIVRYIVATEIDKLRPYLRRIEKATKPGEVKL